MIISSPPPLYVCLDALLEERVKEALRLVAHADAAAREALLLDLDGVHLAALHFREADRARRLHAVAVTNELKMRGRE
jgi:hypothetical protein